MVLLLDSYRLTTDVCSVKARDLRCYVKGTDSPIGPLSWHSSALSSIICHAHQPVLPRHVPDLRSAGISPTDSFGQGHRADGAVPRSPRAQTAAPWSRSLPTRRPMLAAISRVLPKWHW